MAGGRHAVVLISNGFQSEYVVGFANGLARNGLTPLLVCSDRLLRERLDPGVTPLNLQGSEDPRRNPLAKAANLLRYWAATIRLLLLRPAGVVHLIGTFSLPSTVSGLLEALALRLAARRFVLTVHNLLPHDAHDGFNRLVYRLIYRLPHLLVVHTSRMSDGLQREFGVPPDRIVVMEHGIDRVAPPSAGQRKWLRHQCGLDDSRPIVLFFGHVVRYKGLDVLVRAFERLPVDNGPVLVIAGLCRDAMLRQELQGQLAPLVSARRAFWFDGFVPEEHVPHYFHGADLLAMPYRHIDQSGVLFMAMATGLPVVAADVGSLGDYVPLTGGCIVCPGDPAALAAAIETMLLRMRHIDREQVVRQAQRFLWTQTVRPVLHAYWARAMSPQVLSRTNSASAGPRRNPPQG